jgi:hypothetical protein
MDLVINALKANEGEVETDTHTHTHAHTHWILRSPKHFGGFDYADLWLLTFFQLIFGSSANWFINYVCVWVGVCVGVWGCGGVGVCDFF